MKESPTCVVPAIGKNTQLSTKEYQQGLPFLENYVFCLWDSDRGVTNLVEMIIETGEAASK